MMAWGLWQRRNKRLHENIIESLKAIIERALSLHKMFANCSTSKAQKLEKVGYWQLLREGSFELNVDGALFFDLQKAGIRAMVRDSKGEIIMVASKREDPIQDSAVIEGLAI